jgi:hypothetical protein
MTFPPPRTRFSIDDADRAHAEWGANCGPGAVAAICGLTLDEVRPYMGDFEFKHYTNPTLMWQVLERLWPAYGIGYHCRPKQAGAVPLIWPAYGLARIQWEGRWTQPGVPMPVRYRHTHWVGACTALEAHTSEPNIGIFDINAISNGTGWTPESDWASLLVPALIADLKGADGNWHITHCVEIMLPEHTRNRA